VIVTQVASWLGDGAHWQGDGGIPHRLVEHLLMSGAAVLTAVAIALPPSLWLGHTGRGGTAAVNVSNAGRAIPSFALLVLGFQLFGRHQLFGLGAIPTYLTLVALAVPPIVTNSYTGIRQVDPDAREAARGMGMTGGQVLARVEAPLALPLVMAGLRTASVQVVATATLAAVVAWGGLGRFIVDGFAQRDNPQLVAGAILVALLSLLTELALGALQRAVTPPGLRRSPAAGRRGAISTLPGAAAGGPPGGPAPAGYTMSSRREAA